MKPIKVVIIEDEPLAVERLQRQLEKLEQNLEVSAVLESVLQANAWFARHPSPDLILADIQLGDGVSFQIFEARLVSCPIIFTTSYDEFAIRAFKVQSIDYLLKPIKTEELQAAMNKFEKSHSAAQSSWQAIQEKMGHMMAQIERKSTYRQRFLVKHADQLVPVDTAEIAYFFTRNDWVCLTTTGGRQGIVDFTLDELTELLDPAHFYRVNRQCIAAARAIKKAHMHLNGKLKLELEPILDEEVFVSREKAQSFKTWWGG